MTKINYEEIELYLSGEMDPDARQAFQSRMDASPELMQAVEAYREIQDSLERSVKNDDSDQKLKRIFREQNRQWFKDKPEIKKIGFYPALRLAAAAAVIIAMVLVWVPWQPEPAIRYGNIEMIVPAERGDETADLTSKASALFNTGKYNEAIPLLEEALKKKPEDQSLRFYLGVARIHTGNSSAARTELNRVYEGKSVFKYEAAFFLALISYNENNWDAAHSWLDKIPEDADVIEKAEKLRKEMN